jgi:hypothetical protein
MRRLGRPQQHDWFLGRVGAQVEMSDRRLVRYLGGRRGAAFLLAPLQPQEPLLVGPNRGHRHQAILKFRQRLLGRCGHLQYIRLILHIHDESLRAHYPFIRFETTS